MKVIVLLVLGVAQFAQINAIFLSILDEIVDRELYFGLRFNTTRKDCKWRREFSDGELCQDEVKIYLFSNGHQELVNTSQSDWLNTSIGWSSSKENIFFVHGYAGGDNSTPLQLIRDAFIQSNEYNLFLVDYSPVSRAPCYVSLVQNTRYVSRCLGKYMNVLHDAGLRQESITCIGHSMGAHICGLLHYHILFDLNKIIGLDPALPLISERIRLKRKAADHVHVIQTNAGYYGDIGSIGDVNICVNNGNIQPFCKESNDPNLCSHIWSLCFMAQSLFDARPIYAHKCYKVCPTAKIFQIPKLFDKSISNAISDADVPERILIGTKIPAKARGSYCISRATPPFCPNDSNGFGDQKCCSLSDMFA